MRAALPLGLLLLVAVACSSSQETAPPRQARVDPVVDAGTDASVDPACLGPEGCFTCEPTGLSDFLNACTDGQCAPFDNTARLPLFKAGQALPPVP